MKKLLLLPALLTLVNCSNVVDYSDYGDSAYVTATNDYVKPQMKYPDETSFDAMPIATTYSKTDSTYAVCGRGTTKNGFGVEVPIVFKCKLKYLGGDDYDTASWQLIGDLDLSQ